MAVVKVMSYNIQGHAASGRPDHIPKIAEVISATRPDVVGLQEVHCGTRASPSDQAKQIASITGLELAFGRSCRMDGGDYGNAVLTRGSISKTTVHPLPGSGEPRSVLEVSIDLDGTSLSFFATHLAAWGRLLRNARMAQIEALGRITGQATPPRVLVGDFNVPPAAHEMQTLLSRGHLRIVGEPRETTFPMTRQRLDYIFCDAQWEIGGADVVRRGPSDHWAIVADLHVKS